jgi:hypothetical protein
LGKKPKEHQLNLSRIQPISLPIDRHPKTKVRGTSFFCLHHGKHSRTGFHLFFTNPVALLAGAQASSVPVEPTCEQERCTPQAFSQPPDGKPPDYSMEMRTRPRLRLQAHRFPSPIDFPTRTADLSHRHHRNGIVALPPPS